MIACFLCKLLRLLHRDKTNNKLVKRVRRIIVSPGKVTVGEMIACAVAYANGIVVPIHRKEASSSELEDEQVLVLGTGNRYAPETSNFDKKVNNKHVSAFVTLSEYLGNDFAAPWFDIVAQIEQLGPAAFGKEKGEIAAGALDTPLIRLLKRNWVSPIRRVLIANRLSKVLNEELSDYRRFQDLAKVIEVAGVLVGDFTAIPQELMSVRSTYLQRHNVQCTIGINRDALSICSLSPGRLDFCRCEGKPYALFIHPRGFFMTLREKDTSIIETVIRDALCERS